MTTAPTLNGQIIGQTERATRAVFDLVLADADISFESWVTLNLVATPGELSEESLLEQLVTGLRVSPAIAHDATGDGRRRGLITGDTTIRPTPAGSELFERITAGIAGIADRLYGDIPADDLVTARRVLEIVTARARQELARAAA